MGRRRFKPIAITVLGALAAYVAFQVSFVAWTLHKMEHEDPVAAAEAALQRGERSLIAVQGFSDLAPGAGDRYHYNPHLWPHGYRVVPFTSDAPYTDWQIRIARASWVYATKYNAVILAAADSGRSGR